MATELVGRVRSAGVRRVGGGVLALAAVVLFLGWWTHGFRAFTTDGAALVVAGPLPRTAPSLAFAGGTHDVSSIEGYRGRFVLLTFTYLHCPDVCQIVTARLDQGYGQLHDLVPDRMVFISLSLDPGRDDPGTLHVHWEAMGAEEGWIMGSVNPETNRQQRDALTRLGAWFTRQPDGRINHSASSFLIDPDGQVVAIYRPEVTTDSMVASLRALVR